MENKGRKWQDALNCSTDSILTDFFHFPSNIIPMITPLSHYFYSSWSWKPFIGFIWVYRIQCRVTQQWINNTADVLVYLTFTKTWRERKSHQACILSHSSHHQKRWSDSTQDFHITSVSLMKKTKCCCNEWPVSLDCMQHSIHFSTSQLRPLFNAVFTPEAIKTMNTGIRWRKHWADFPL